MRTNLINARKKIGYTQKQIAQVLEMTERHYQDLEAGTSDGSMKVWKKLRSLLNKTIDYLEQIEEKPQPIPQISDAAQKKNI